MEEAKFGRGTRTVPRTDDRKTQGSGCACGGEAADHSGLLCPWRIEVACCPARACFLNSEQIRSYFKTILVGRANSPFAAPGTVAFRSTDTM